MLPGKFGYVFHEAPQGEAVSNLHCKSSLYHQKEWRKQLLQFTTLMNGATFPHQTKTAFSFTLSFSFMLSTYETPINFVGDETDGR